MHMRYIPFFFFLSRFCEPYMSPLVAIGYGSRVIPVASNAPSPPFVCVIEKRTLSDTSAHYREILISLNE